MKNKRYIDINYRDSITAFLVLLFCGILNSVHAQKTKPVEPPKPVAYKDGKLVYTADAKGNRIPDFSYAGYGGGDKPVPDATVKVFVPVEKPELIQKAIDYLAKQPIGKDGLRGAILLEKGTYVIDGAIRIQSSGIVLRGSGAGKDGTILFAKGLDRIGVIRILGKADKVLNKEEAITDQYVPVNALSVNVSNPSNYKVGDAIVIRRPSTKNWIDTLKTAEFGGGISSLGWKPNTRDLIWDRTVVAVKGNTITFDAPITTALDEKFGGGFISKYQWNGRVANCGVENLSLVSNYHKENPKDEYHRWNAITIENAQDAWVRRVNFEHFAGSAVSVLESAKRVTVEDCKSINPVSEIGGERRNTFFTSGQQVLFQRLYAENGMHDFAVGFCAPGPNAFVQCQSVLPFGFSGAIDSWASGTLFDIVNVDGQALSVMNRSQDGQGAGWAGANSVIWQCSASRVDNYQPPTAQNWAFGTWAQFAGDGYWDFSNEQIQPRSFYYAQLKDRIGAEADKRKVLLPVETEASSSPPVSVAMALTKVAVKPALTLAEFIDSLNSNASISTAKGKAISIEKVKEYKVLPEGDAFPMEIKNGWLVRQDELVLGNRQQVPWWNGSARPYGLKSPKFHVTRFVPGKEGMGLTDDLDAITDSMKNGSLKILEHNYGLWYDRRRDDHERIRRMDGEVWAPFYELPFARSGKETAWDGLSKYDISKYNLWYWDRLKQFANLADEKGLVLVHDNYFQHNIIEAGAHYADFPWRTANNINSTGFPEPVPYAGDKRIFMAEQFYDINSKDRRELHRAYIRQCLNNFVDNNSVIQLIGEEFTGPLHFVQFWVDVVKEWEQETGKHPIIGLSVTKDVQDAILADAKRAKVIDLIDIKYWHYQADGKAYEPQGGQNLAPRQHARLLKPKASSFAQVYRAVSEYKAKFPEKAVIYSADGYDRFGWAILMAGGSLSNASFPKGIIDFQKNKLQSFMLMDQIYGLKSDKGFVFYNSSGKGFSIDLKQSKGKYKLQYVNPKDGKILREETVNGGQSLSVVQSNSSDQVIILNQI